MLSGAFRRPRSPLAFATTLALLLAAALVGVEAGPSRAAAPRTLALTFDDLPFAPRVPELGLAREKTRQLLSALKAAEAPAIGFVNEDKLLAPDELEARIALLEAWLDAGLTLGNHGFGHLDFQTTLLERYQDAVVQGEVVTRWLLGRRGAQPRYYRHPMTHTGPTRETRQAFDAFLAARGYAVAPFTVENADYIFEALHAAARRRDDTALASRLAQAYLDHTEAVVAFCEAESRELFSREIPQILLLHANVLNAEVMPELLARLRGRGYGFVDLDTALADPAYASPDQYVGPRGPSWLHRWRVARGQDVEAAIRREPDPPRWVLDLWSARSAAGR
jgi:peptidoglycan/xylan/chitin deacetylase (PgdA/CDA1 family)